MTFCFTCNEEGLNASIVEQVNLYAITGINVQKPNLPLLQKEGRAQDQLGLVRVGVRI